VQQTRGKRWGGASTSDAGGVGGAGWGRQQTHEPTAHATVTPGGAEGERGGSSRRTSEPHKPPPPRGERHHGGERHRGRRTSQPHAPPPLQRERGGSEGGSADVRVNNTRHRHRGGRAGGWQRTHKSTTRATATARCHRRHADGCRRHLGCCCPSALPVTTEGDAVVVDSGGQEVGCSWSEVEKTCMGGTAIASLSIRLRASTG